MTPNDFVTKLKEQKEKAHSLLAEAEGYDIRRGMGHSISGFLEDLFAAYIAANVKRQDLIYFVDKVTSFKFGGMEKARSIKPDLLILNKRDLIATHYYDLKTDIGFGRDMKENLKRWNDLILSLRGNRAWITVNKKREYEIQFAESIKYTVVIAIDWNVNEKTLNKNRHLAEGLEGIELYVLINKKPEKDFIIHSDQFEKLITSCQRQML
jgi:hypothetical protein